MIPCSYALFKLSSFSVQRQLRLTKAFCCRMQEYYLSVLSAPRPGRASKMMAFCSDLDLAKLGRSGSSGSDTNGQQRNPVAFSSQLYNSLVSATNASALLLSAS